MGGSFSAQRAYLNDMQLAEPTVIVDVLTAGKIVCALCPIFGRQLFSIPIRRATRLFLSC